MKYLILLNPTTALWIQLDLKFERREILSMTRVRHRGGNIVTWGCFSVKYFGPETFSLICGPSSRTMTQNRPQNL